MSCIVRAVNPAAWAVCCAIDAPCYAGSGESRDEEGGVFTGGMAATVSITRLRTGSVMWLHIAPVVARCCRCGGWRGDTEEGGTLAALLIGKKVADTGTMVGSGGSGFGSVTRGNGEQLDWQLWGMTPLALRAGIRQGEDDAKEEEKVHSGAAHREELGSDGTPVRVVAPRHWLRLRARKAASDSVA
jgi:hypothetical protein